MKHETLVVPSECKCLEEMRNKIASLSGADVELKLEGGENLISTDNSFLRTHFHSVDLSGLKADNIESAEHMFLGSTIYSVKFFSSKDKLRHLEKTFACSTIKDLDLSELTPDKYHEYFNNMGMFAHSDIKNLIATDSSITQSYEDRAADTDYFDNSSDRVLAYLCCI